VFASVQYEWSNESKHAMNPLDAKVILADSPVGRRQKYFMGFSNDYRLETAKIIDELLDSPTGRVERSTRLVLARGITEAYVLAIEATGEAHE
jgi:hypothetical protein